MYFLKWKKNNLNFLAHSFLTFSDEQIIGQFLQDFIRNKDRFSYPMKIQEGITLHREIDTFTDAHAAVLEAKKVFRPLVGLYAGAFVDVAFDFFLANSMENILLKGHATHVYSALRRSEVPLPDPLLRMLHYMEKDNWLYNYRFDHGIRFSMQNVLNKAKYLNAEIPVFEAFVNEKEFLGSCFTSFFPDLEQHCKIVHSSFQNF